MIFLFLHQIPNQLSNIKRRGIMVGAVDSIGEVFRYFLIPIFII